MKEINASEFENEVLKAKGPVLVDYAASWCQPCKMLSKSLVEFCSNDPTFKVVKVDIDKNMGLATQYDIRGVPTLILFVDGKPVSSMTGYKTVNELNSFVNN